MFNFNLRIIFPCLYNCTDYTQTSETTDAESWITILATEVMFDEKTNSKKILKITRFLTKAKKLNPS